MKRNRILLMVLGLSISLVACNNSKKTGNTDVAGMDSTGEVMGSNDTTDTADGVSKFVMEAANGGMMEVELGTLAQQNAANKRVKAFGAMMVKDHGAANAELKQLAQNKSITLPNSVQGEHKEHVDELRKKKGIEFDKEYMKMMVDDHQKDISKFEDAAKDLTDPDLKAFASKTLPVLNKHLDSAKAINKTVEGTLHPGDVSNGIERQSYP